LIWILVAHEIRRLNGLNHPIWIKLTGKDRAKS